jgi:tetratricopeptide (TPR) repeat protein
MEEHIYVSSEVGLTIREARKSKGFRQEDLIVDCFLSTGTISKIERGSVHVSREKLTYLCEKLEVDINVAEPIGEEEDEVDLSLQLLSIENHMNMVSPEEAWEELRRIHPQEEVHRVWIIYLKGRYYEKKGKKQQAKIYYLQVTELDDPELIESNLSSTSYHALGRISFYEDRLEEALGYMDKGLTCFQQNGERKQIGYHLQISKIIYLEKLDRNEEALLEVEKLWSEKQDIDSREVILSMYEMKTRLFTKLLKYEQAIDLGKEGLITARVNRMYDHTSALWLALGESYSQQGKLNNAEICYKSAVNMVDKMQNNYLIIQTFLQMGQLYQQINCSQKAYQMYEKAVSISRIYSDNIRLTETLEQMGDYFFEVEEQVKAKDAYLEALQFAKEQSNKLKIGNLLMKLARFYHDMDRKQYYDYLEQYYKVHTFE